MMERSLPDDASSDGIHFDRPRGMEWLNGVFQKHINFLESDMLERAHFTFAPPIPPFFATMPLSGHLDSTSIRTRQLGSTPMEADEAESSMPQSSMVYSVVVVDNKKAERSAETSRARYLEMAKELDLDDFACRQELAEVRGLKKVSHEDLSRHNCVDWLKTHEALFSRTKTMETADLTGFPQKSIKGPVNCRQLKQLGSPGLIVDSSKHRTSLARIS